MRQARRHQQGVAARPPRPDAWEDTSGIWITPAVTPERLRVNMLRWRSHVDAAGELIRTPEYFEWHLDLWPSAWLMAQVMQTLQEARHTEHGDALDSCYRLCLCLWHLDHPSATLAELQEMLDPSSAVTLAQRLETLYLDALQSSQPETTPLEDTHG